MPSNGSGGAHTCLFEHFTADADMCFRGDMHTHATVDIIIILHVHSQPVIISGDDDCRVDGSLPHTDAR